MNSMKNIEQNFKKLIKDIEHFVKSHPLVKPLGIFDSDDEIELLDDS